jgi:hypothetical protein
MKLRLRLPRFLWIRRYFYRRVMMKRMIQGGVPRQDADRFIGYILGDTVSDTPLASPRVMKGVADALIHARRRTDDWIEPLRESTPEEVNDEMQRRVERGEFGQ